MDSRRWFRSSGVTWGKFEALKRWNFVQKCVTITHSSALVTVYLYKYIFCNNIHEAALYCNADHVARQNTLLFLPLPLTFEVKLLESEFVQCCVALISWLHNIHLLEGDCKFQVPFFNIREECNKRGGEGNHPSSSLLLNLLQWLNIIVNVPQVSDVWHYAHVWHSDGFCFTCCTRCLHDICDALILTILFPLP